MDNLINEIVGLLNPGGRIDRRLYRGAIGVGVSSLFFLLFVKGLFMILDVAKKASLERQENVAIICTVVFVFVFLFYFYYLIRYAALLLITLLQYGFTLRRKNTAQTIVSIMTSEVEDKNRMHKAIIKHLKEYSTPKDFAALYIWLSGKHLIYSTDQTKYLELLKADFPDTTNQSELKNYCTRVPSASSFSEAKTKLEQEGINDKEAYWLLARKLGPFIREV